jgi:hypothetical protein
MYISHVRLSEIRGFAGPRTVDLSLRRPDGTFAGWTVLAGRNGSGKSTLLRALALAVSGTAVANSLVDDFRGWVTHNSTEGRATISVVPGDGDVGVPLASSPTEISLGLRWAKPGPPGTSPTSRRAARPQLSIGEFTDTAAETGPWSSNPGWLCAGYGPFRRLADGRGDQSPRVARLSTLFSENATLAEGVAWLIDQHLRAFEKKSGAIQLKSAALSVLSDGLLPDDYSVDEVDSDGLWVSHYGHPFPLREMSDGYQTVTALVVDILKQIFDAFDDLPTENRGGVPTITAPGVVLIDEVDAHLHISWQKRIGSWLKAHFPNIQFIVSTHSTYICQDADPGGLIRLPGPTEILPPVVVEPDLWERIVYGSGYDAATSELFGVDTPYSALAERLRRELIALETAVITGAADEFQVKRYTELRQRLQSSAVARSDEVSARLRAFDS